MKKHVIILPAMFGLLLAGCATVDAKSTVPGSLPYAVPLPVDSNDDLPPEINNSSLESSDSCSCSDDEEESEPTDSRWDFGPGQKKPVIYFYPEEEMDLTVNVTKDYLLTTTYPEYKDGWNIHLKEDGTFTVPGSTREYYALYFEAESDYACTFDEGFYVTAPNAASFLEEKMDYMGFTNRETNEFIMYWLPILERNEQSLVYFEQTEERNEDFPLSFSEEPNTLIRTMIHIKKVDAPTDIEEEQLTHYERGGFTVTEWGGVEY